MIAADLEGFIAHLSKRSFDFAGWYDKLKPDGPKGYKNVKDELKRIFERTLLQDAVELVDAIIGTEDEPTYGSGWIKVLRRRLRVCKDSAPRRLEHLPDDQDGNETFACHWCLDTGTVLCVDPRSIKRADDGEPDGQGAMQSCGYGCSCEKNQRRDRSAFIQGKHVLWRDFVEAIGHRPRKFSEWRAYRANLDPIAAHGGREWNPDE